MTSGGQVVGGIVGAVIGFYTGGPAGAIYGAQLGMAVGGVLDPPKGPTISGPRLSDLSFQTSSYGVPLARVYGTVPIVGNIFWLENNQLKETVKKKKQGGKGGPSTTTKTYSYSATFAVALCDTSKTGPILGVRRIWIGSNLAYNAGSDDLETIIASYDAVAGTLLTTVTDILAGNADAGSDSVNWKLYFGTPDQTPDPRMQADIGVDDCPAYRNTAYIVFNDLQLEKYGNSLQAAQVKVEVFTAESTELQLIQTSEYDYVNPTGEASLGPRPYYVTPEKVVFWVPQWGASYPANSTWIVHEIYAGGAHSQYTASAGAPHVPPHGDSDGAGESWDSVNDLFPITAAPVVGASGYFQRRGEIVAGITLESGNYKLYSKDSDESEYGPITLPVSPGCIAIDENSDIWVFTASGAKQYDTSLTLLNTHAIALPTPHFPFARAEAVDGVFMLYDRNDNGGVYRIDIDALTCELITALPDAPVQGYYDYSIYMDAGMLVRACSRSDDVPGDTILVVEWFNLAKVSAGVIPLADIVSAELQLSNLIESGDIDVSELTADVRGYRIAGGSIRGAVAPPQGAYPFDLIPSGYQIKAVPRGQASVATIDIGELGAVSGTGMADVVLDGPSREMDTQIPRKLVVKHLDAERDYDINEQSAERSATDSVDIETQDIALVMTPDEAAGMAQTLLYVRWLERNDYAHTLPPTYNALEPADVIDVVTEYATIPLRLTEISYGADGVLQCKAKPNASAIYTPNATGGQGVVSGGTVPLGGDSLLVLMDIPLLPTMFDQSSYLATMGSYASGWKAGAAMRSLDNEATFEQMAGFSGMGTFGRAIGVLSVDDGYVIDYTATLSINLICGTLESFTVDQLLIGKGLYAYGADGRWEILNAANAELQVDGTYLLSTFLRGCYGTEWATGLHQADDYIVFLDDVDNLQILLDISVVGVPAYWRGITAGKDISTASSQALTYSGALLKPLSPVNPSGVKDGGGGFVLTWNRRSRKSANWFVSGIEPAIGESVEQYEIEIYNGLTLLRTLDATEPTVTYTAAQQIADFGSAQSSLTVKIYQISQSVGRGYALSATVAALNPAPVLLMHFDGVSGSAVMTDAIGHTMTAVGNAKLSNAQAMFGATSLLLDGNGDYVTTPYTSDFNFGSDDFTVEMWIRPTALPASYAPLFSQSEPIVASFANLGLGITNTGVITAGCRPTTAGANTSINSAAAAVVISTWQHVAFVRYNGLGMIFVNGSLVISGAIPALTDPGINVVGIGASGNGYNVTTEALNGHIDELRVIKGTAVYTSAFTPPAAPF